MAWISPELEALAQVFSLRTGEWEALRVAMEHRPGLLLTDDTAARLAAGNLCFSSPNGPCNPCGLPKKWVVRE